jgi:hypothetical protein
VIELLIFKMSARGRLVRARGTHTHKDNVMPQLNFRSRLARLPMMLLALFVVVLQGCSDDPAPVVPPVVNAVPTGYYDVTGTASVSDGAGGTIALNDLQAMVNGDRIMMMSAANGLLYDGTITSISENDFTATFMIYTDGENPITATATGTITQGSSITGTLTGSGVGSGIFSLSYAMSNNQAAAISRVENRLGHLTWGGDLVGNGAFTYDFSINNLGVLTHAGDTGNGIFATCQINGSVSPISGTSLYEVSVSLSVCANPLVNGTTYTGLATSRSDSTVDDTLVLGVTNGTYSPFGDFI